MGVDHTRVSPREFPTGHRVSRHRQPVIGFRTGKLLFGGLSALALLLALGGIHGVLSYSVTRQLPEIGVRLARGATPGDLH
jgi:hypothetical protein